MTHHAATEYPRTRLLGVSVDCVSESESVHWICNRAISGRGGFVITVNLDHLRRYRLDESYQSLVESADLVVADGMPLVWASRIRGQPYLPERVAGSTMCLQLCEEAANRGIPIFLLGGDPGIAERAAQILVQQYPELRISGTYCPPFGFERDPASMNRLTDAIAIDPPMIVLVALGSPKQERLIGQLREHYQKHCWMGVGISLSFIAGDVARAPVWMQRVGLEWAHRLAQEPRRLFARYIIYGIPWGFVLLSSALINRFRILRPSPDSKEQ